VHRYLTKGVVNAKFAAPWYYTDDSDDDDDDDDEKDGGDDDETKDDENVATSTPAEGDASSSKTMASPEDAMVSGIQGLTIIASSSSESPKEQPPQVRYLLDYTLNRFCRWLRILGLDAALETEEEERLRTKESKL
jgi:hypothetical protein